MNFLDKLPKIPFLTPEKPHQETFFALNIDLDKVTAAVWTIAGDRLHVLNTATIPYQNGDDFKTEESLVALIDAANYSLDEALAALDPEPTKLLFGVPDSWLEEENLKPNYLKVLKKMVEELGVEPMAYVSTTHAIAHLLQKQHGIPLSAVLVEVADPLVVAVIKGGKTQGFSTKIRGEKISDDVQKALAQFSEIEVFPSRILLFGEDENLEKIKDELSSYSWMDQLPFLHLPKVELLDDQIGIEATTFAGAFELNPQIPPEIGIAPKVGRASQLSHHLPAEDQPARAARAVNEAGFVAGDIRDYPEEEFSGMEEPSQELLEQEDQWVEGPSQRHLPAQPGNSQPDLLAALTAPFGTLTSGGNGRGLFSFLTNKLIVLPLLVLILLVSLFIFLPKASVAVFVDMKPLENSAQIVADPTISQVDQANNKIPGKIVETDVNGSLDGQATGKKQVGDPAKGKVVVYNATSQTLNLSKGTVLTADSGKKFTLDNSVQVASKSASAAEPPTRSEAIDSTASDIGPEGNIAAGTDLKVTGFDKADVVAKVDTAFTGGVSKEVTVVTSDDQQKLLAQLTGQLKQKARDQLQTTLTGDLKVLPESFSEKINKKTYSKNVGDQADKFNLNLTAHYKGTAFSDADLKSLAAKLVQTNIPDASHYSVDSSQAEVSAEVTKVDASGKLYFNATFKAKLTPKFDTESLKTKIAGKSVDQAQQILRDSEAQIIGANIKLSPSLPGPFQRLPIRKENISIEVTAK